MMKTVQGFIITCILLVSFVAFPTGNAAKVRGSAPAGDASTTKKITCTTTIMVGAGNKFTTIQAAIDSVPLNNPKWICIRVKAGTYKEKITVPRGKTFIYLQGEGQSKTNVAASAHISIETSATISVEADNFIAQDITFINTYNVPYSKSVSIKPAVAALLLGDKLAFYQCGFVGLQDTLWDSQGRHYFKSCTIVGGVDFIFGAGQSLYEKCTISVTGKVLLGPGFITAQGRSTSNEPNGFVFKECTITGNGQVYLGRAWRPYARVIFFNTVMGNVVVPQGWDAWYNKGKENQLTFDEINCQGLGASKAQRVGWANKHSMSQLQDLMSLSYINGLSWVPM